MPFDIPDNWIWVRLKSISNISSGGTPDRSTPKYWNGNIPWLKISDITSSNKYVNKATEYITEEGMDNSSAKVMPKGTILYTIFATIGEVGILNFDATCNQAIAGLNTYERSINDYLYFFLVNLQDYMKSISKGCAQFNINQKILKETLIALPPLSEQKRIVDKINLFDKLINKYDELEKKLTTLESEFPENLKKSILQYAIEGKLVKQDPNDEPASVLLERIKAEKEKLIKEGKIKRDKNESYIYQGDDKNYYEKVGKINDNLNVSDYTFALPDSWVWCTLNELAKQITDGTHRTPTYTTTGIPFLSIANISSGKYDGKPKYISIEEHKSLIQRCNPELNDILLCRIGTLGRPFINKLDFEYSIFVSLGLIKLIDRCMSEYVKVVLDSPNSYNFINYVKVGGGTHTFKINVEDIGKFPIPLPPIKEQLKILNKITKIIEQINCLLY